MDPLRKKFTANEPCWCGSGKKFKKCHRDRQTEQPVQLWDAELQYQNEKSGTCLYVDAVPGNECGKPAIGSHTVPRSMLSLIAPDGHVYRHTATVLSLSKTQGKISCEKIGV